MRTFRNISVVILIVILGSCAGMKAKKNGKAPDLVLEYGFKCGYYAEIEGVRREVCLLTKDDQVALEQHLILWCK